MSRSISINGRKIGAHEPAYVIAEMSANHGQDFEQAIQIIKAAKDAGADAVKVQTYTPDTLTIAADNARFRISSGTLWDGRTLYDLYAEAYTPWEWQPRLKAAAEDIGIELFSTPFDDSAVDFLEKMDVAAYKIASFELVDIPLIRRVARTGKPIIISTGMADVREIAEAVDVARSAGAGELALLKCNSAYPAPPEEMNLRTIPHMAELFDVVTGVSDHTLTTAVPVVAITLGARIIEKHFCLSRSAPGPDVAFSLEPGEFKQMVSDVRDAEKALGHVNYAVTPREQKSRQFRRSLYVVEDVAANETFTTENVRSIRPAGGLHTRYFDDILGRRATCDVQRGTPLSWAFVGDR